MVERWFLFDQMKQLLRFFLSLLFSVKPILLELMKIVAAFNHRMTIDFRSPLQFWPTCPRGRSGKWYLMVCRYFSAGFSLLDCPETLGFHTFGGHERIGLLNLIKYCWNTFIPSTFLVSFLPVSVIHILKCPMSVNAVENWIDTIS